MVDDDSEETAVGFFRKGDIDWHGWALRVLGEVIDKMDNADRTRSEMKLMERAREALRVLTVIPRP